MIEFLSLAIPLQIMFLDFKKYCSDRSLPVPVITRIIDERIPGVSKTDTHKDGRAIDISSKGWHADEIEDVVSYFAVKYEDWGAIPFPTHDTPYPDPNPLVHHYGVGYHFHLQIRPDISYYELKH